MTTATGIQVKLPSGSRREANGTHQWDVSEFEHKVPPPRYRHAAPSAPWPWMDFNQDNAHVRPLTPNIELPWSQYPQSHFGNWTPDQVGRCKMLTICQDQNECRIHNVDVFWGGKFYKPESEPEPRVVYGDSERGREFWDELQTGLDEKLRLRALFIEDMNMNVLQMLGAKYDIEPFFFASSANWIPSRYQENPHHAQGDHITVVLPFIRTVNNRQEANSPTPSSDTQYTEKGDSGDSIQAITDEKQIIDTQAPLILSDKKILLQDLLAIHMVRNTGTNIIISYHHRSDFQKTTAKRLRSLVQRTGDSVYWSKLYDKSKDPTLVFLAILWYALYAWDEALEVLYAHLSETLEARDITKNLNKSDDDLMEDNKDGSMHLDHARELHKLQAHMLYYQQLLRDFEKSVEFVKKTVNPAMDDPSITEDERQKSKQLLEQEAVHLLSEIQRLEKQRSIQSDRLKNASQLAYSTVNIEDSRSMQKLTKATMKDSAAMKQISYLTMIFLPASYLSSVFGMNVAEINPGTLETLANYVASTIILTAITAWVMVALQDDSCFHNGGRTSRDVMKRIAWPVVFIYDKMLKKDRSGDASHLER
ncbi:hypothetical protein JVU11DRAFT_7992 [Chiua virens]|nr:hypothetical protein JVU11DRAFT_7992 [Chiua virens]